MLPSKGYFRKEDCPFFDKGLCKRPNCHFRHRKKVTSDELTPEILQAVDVLSPTPITNLNLQTTNSIPPVEYSTNQTSQDSLFARLVNQSNSYPKTNRHIPCAYTPTPKCRTLQPKYKPASVTNIDGRTLAHNEPSQQKLGSESDLKISETVTQESINPLTNYVPTKGTTEETKYVPNSNSDLQSVNQYIPSKETSKDCPYVPSGSSSISNSNNEIQSSNQYIPSKGKFKKSHYVPETIGNVTNPVSYTPSEKSASVESTYEPGKVESLADYVPTGLPATGTGSKTWLAVEDLKDFEFEFNPSEIEMLKEELKNDIEEIGKEMKVTETEAGAMEGSKSEKKKDKNDRSSSRHSSSSSSRRHSSSSRSKHKSSHKSSSSKHSSSRNKSSSHHHSSSSRHKSSKSKSSSHEKNSSKRSHDESNDRNHKRHRAEEKRAETSRSKEQTPGSSPSDEGVQAWSPSNVSDGIKLSDDEVDLGDLSDDPDTVTRQCLEIFNNYSGSNDPKESRPMETSVSGEDSEMSHNARKRTAHATSLTSDHSVLRDKTHKKPHTIKSARDVLNERYKILEKQQEQPPPQPPVRAPLLGLNRPPVRIAAVRNIQQMIDAKKAIQEKINKGQRVNERTTIAQTVSHGSSRIAHVPAAKEAREIPTITGGSKQVPRHKRQAALDKLLIETNKIFPTKGESYEEALKLEEEVFQAHSGSLPAYNAGFVALLVKTRRRVASVKGEASGAAMARAKVSHFDVLSGGKKNFSFLKSRKLDISMLSERHIYEEMLRWKLTPEELKENGFPIESDRPGYATCALNFELKYNDKYIYIKKMTGNKRYCIRCSQQYDVDPVTLEQYKEGPETCCYHAGKKKSGGRNSERVYSCCNSASSEGCATHIRHVTDTNDYENLPNCVRTFPKSDDENPGVFALDCEMVYTRLGYELARVTVVNLRKEIVYDTLVKPKYPIECYNSMYSGIEEKTMEGVETTLKDVQAVLLSMFSDKTVLIGHSLDSDLRSLHLIHDTVVDTSVVYKNEKYHPYKYSLKDLCVKKISKIIQDNVGGHDSSEDAIAALEIMLNHIKEEVGKYDSLESYEADRLR